MGYNPNSRLTALVKSMTAHVATPLFTQFHWSNEETYSGHSVSNYSCLTGMLPLQVLSSFVSSSSGWTLTDPTSRCPTQQQSKSIGRRLARNVLCYLLRSCHTNILQFTLKRMIVRGTGRQAMRDTHCLCSTPGSLYGRNGLWKFLSLFPKYQRVYTAIIASLIFRSYLGNLQRDGPHQGNLFGAGVMTMCGCRALLTDLMWKWNKGANIQSKRRICTFNAPMITLIRHGSTSVLSLEPWLIAPSQ